MAWVRTAVTIMLVGAWATRLALVQHQGWAAALGAFGSAAGLVSVLLWWGRARRSSRAESVAGRLAGAPPGAAASALVAVLCIGVVSLSLTVRILT